MVSKMIASQFALSVLQVALASSALTDPGPLRTGEITTLTCNITGIGAVWRYTDDNGTTTRIASIRFDLNFLPPTDPVMISGISFHVSAMMPTGPNFVSQVSFEASERMNGRVISCMGVTETTALNETSIILQVFNLSDCGRPVFLPGGNISPVTNTTEGATVSFQCEEGLFLPSGSNSAVIRCTRINNLGQWIPNPASLECSRLEGPLPNEATTDNSQLEDTVCISVTLVSAVSSVAAFIIGVVVGAIASALVACCIYKRMQQRKPSSVPVAPLYDDVAGPSSSTSTAIYEESQVQLNKNVAYGQTKRVQESEYY